MTVNKFQNSKIPKFGWPKAAGYLEIWNPGILLVAATVGFSQQVPWQKTNR